MYKNLNTPVISKIVIIALICVAIIGAAFAIWISYQPEAQSTATTSSTSSPASSTSSPATSSVSNNEIDSEISQLDTIIGSVDDTNISDAGYSESDLGIQ